MNSLDVILITILGYNTFLGLKQGAIRTLSNFIGLFIAFTITKGIYPTIVTHWQNILPTFKSYSFAYFGITFIIILLIVQCITHTLHILLQWTGVGLINHTIGAGIGLAKGIVFALLISIPLILSQSRLTHESTMLHNTQPFIKIIIRYLNDNQYFNNILKTLRLSTPPLKIKA